MLRVFLFLLFWGMVICGYADDDFQYRSPRDMIYLPEEDCYLVAYLLGDPTQKNGNGYISKVHTDLVEPLTKKFCKELDAPNALALTDLFIVVADLGSLKFFDRKRGTWQKTMVFGEPPLSLITDVVYDGSRYLYACDLFANSLIQIDMHNKMAYKVLDHGPWLKFPHRLLYDPLSQTLILGSYKTGEIIQFNPVNKKYKRLIQYGPPRLNGLEMDGRFNLYLSSTENNGKIFQVTPELKYTVLDESDPFSTNIYINSHTNELLLMSQSSDFIQRIDL